VHIFGGHGATVEPGAVYALLAVAEHAGALEEDSLSPAELRSLAAGALAAVLERSEGPSPVLGSRKSPNQRPSADQLPARRRSSIFQDRRARPTGRASTA
jgi:hypothetical protein